MLTCQKCASIDNYHIEDAGLWKKAICNNCDYYITWLPMRNISYCIHCGEVDSLEGNYCTNCGANQDTPRKIETLPDEQPVLHTMAQEQIFAPGVRLFDKHPNAPDFVLASQVISLDEFFNFCHQNPQYLADYQGKKQLKLQILRSKEGKIYTAIDTFGTPAHQAPPPPPPATPQQGWGAAPAPAPQQYPQYGAPAPAPAQQAATNGGWGAPPAQQQAATGPAPYQDQLPF